jgi:hypothetical protein
VWVARSASGWRSSFRGRTAAPRRRGAACRVLGPLLGGWHSSGSGIRPTSTSVLSTPSRQSPPPNPPLPQRRCARRLATRARPRAISPRTADSVVPSSCAASAVDSPSRRVIVIASRWASDRLAIAASTAATCSRVSTHWLGVRKLAQAARRDSPQARSRCGAALSRLSRRGSGPASARQTFRNRADGLSGTHRVAPHPGRSVWRPASHGPNAKRVTTTSPISR